MKLTTPLNNDPDSSESFLRPLTANFPLSKQWPMSEGRAVGGRGRPPPSWAGPPLPTYAGSSEGICSPGHSVKLQTEQRCSWFENATRLPKRGVLGRF